MKRIEHLLHLDAMTATGTTVGERLKGVDIFDDEVIRTLDNPIIKQGGLAVLRGNLAPNDATIKPSAASPHPMKHQGKAVVFECVEDMKARLDDPELDVDQNSILVLKNCGPKGYPGMAEVGNMPLPKKILDLAYVT